MLQGFSVSSFPPSYAEFSNWLSVDGATDRAQPFITYKYIRPGSSVLLACDIGVDWPAYRNITWTLNRSPVIMQLHMQEVLEAVEATSSAPGHMMLPNGSLYLWSVPQVLNGGIYQCHATSPSGMVAGSSTETRLMVSAQGEWSVIAKGALWLCLANTFKSVLRMPSSIYFVYGGTVWLLRLVFKLKLILVGHNFLSFMVCRASSKEQALYPPFCKQQISCCWRARGSDMPSFKLD